GAMIIDTPGMRELGNIGIADGIEQTFDEIAELSQNCKYADCTHTIEKGCAILAALEEGDLKEERYKNYIKLKKESEYYERSYLERKRRDKEFGKMIKTILKNKKK
ncbi:MAG: ribosome small subunit-dependent GTPase A, partial [Melioribacteraceae bacterium]|nr:ribosome small subunit-dependent GTPase A [Melioribacteraceae bacterium]